MKLIGTMQNSNVNLKNQGVTKMTKINAMMQSQPIASFLLHVEPVKAS
jgi:hypothetical protein